MQSIYDILSLREADEDNKPAQQQPPEEDNFDDDFSIDTSLDDGSSPEEDAAAAQEENPDSGGEQPSDKDGGEGSEDDGAGAPVDDDGTQGEEDEEVEANTDIFASLSAEEQQIKIKELKKLFSSLYSSCDDILDRINKLDINEDNLDAVSRISTTLYDIKIYISDYLTLIFPTKSYVENDITFNRFLTIIKSITDIFDDISKKYIREIEKDKKE